MTRRNAHSEKSEKLLAPSSLLKNATVYHINVNDIAPNQDQPRKTFDDRSLKELSDSIRVHGVIQPVIVTKQGLHYRLVAGERRWRASRLAGLKTIPAIVRELSDQDVMQQALIENIQREDLNPIEESRAYLRLLHDYRLTQEQLAEVVGKSRSTVANSLRLNQLAPSVQDMLNDGLITAGHARAILSVGDHGLQELFANTIIKEGLSVRVAEKRSKTFSDEVEREQRKKQQEADARRVQEAVANGNVNLLSAEESQRIYIETALIRHFDRSVRFDWQQGKGKIILNFNELEELESILDKLGIDLES